jgi:hypothetical protein
MALFPVRNWSAARRKSSASKPLWNRRQGYECAVCKKRPVGREHVHVRVEVRQVPEALHEQDEPGPRARRRLGVPFDEQARSDAAQLAESRPVPAEDRARGASAA